MTEPLGLKRSDVQVGPVHRVPVPRSSRAARGATDTPCYAEVAGYRAASAPPEHVGGSDRRAVACGRANLGWQTCGRIRRGGSRSVRAISRPRGTGRALGDGRRPGASGSLARVVRRRDCSRRVSRIGIRTGVRELAAWWRAAASTAIASTATAALAMAPEGPARAAAAQRTASPTIAAFRYALVPDMF